MVSDSALRIFVAIVLAVMLLASGLTGRPGSILGALIDPADMLPGNIGGESGGTF